MNREPICFEAIFYIVTCDKTIDETISGFDKTLYQFVINSEIF